MSIESRCSQYGTVFTHWQVGERLGGGSGGKTGVFRLVRRDAPQVTSAMKAISLIEERGRLEDLPDYRRREYEIARQQCTESAYQEVLLMLGLEGYSNIVDYKDHGFVDWTDETGFGRDMLIRMVGLHSDGTLDAVGLNANGQCNVQDLYSDSPIVSIAAGYEHTVALHADGTVTAIGRNNLSQCEVSEWRDIIAICAGSEHTVGLRADGTVVATGKNVERQCNVNDWVDITAISAGDYYTVGLKADGTVVAVGLNAKGQCYVNDWTDVVEIAAGNMQTLGLCTDGSILYTGEPAYRLS